VPRSEADKRAALRELFAAYQTHPSGVMRALREQANFVPGVGSVTPAVVFVGEAPGGRENDQRRPFCGPSGTMLDELLDGIGLDRKDIWITNCVKYRPDANNRNPTSAEKEASWPYLRRELEILGCPYIVTLGKQPLSVFVGNRPHDVLRARWRTVVIGSKEFWLLPLFHPAVGVYQRSRRPLLHQEFAVIREKVHGVAHTTGRRGAR
jgi:uracil-DNA glycosylase family 4